MPPSDRQQGLPGVCSVAVIGAGPSGLAIATQLNRLGVTDVVVLERESEAGGIPRHCGHIPFGLREFKRCLTGPVYAKRLIQQAEEADVCIYKGVSVVKAGPGGQLVLSSRAGIHQLQARHVVLCTGVRETPRSARLVTGQRPAGIVTTGELQSMVYLKNRRPFVRPVVVGTELVSFSALLTCHHAKIKPVAMIEERKRVTARHPSGFFPPLLGIKLILDSELQEVLGRDRVAAVQVQKHGGSLERINCDGIIFSGQFTPESSLLRGGHIAVDVNTGGPVVDQYCRCSDPAYFAAGNLLRPVETAGWCWQEGRDTAAWVAQSLRGQLPDSSQSIGIRVASTEHIRFAVPQRLCFPGVLGGTPAIQIRFHQRAQGRLCVYHQSCLLWSRELSVLPERRFLVPLKTIESKLKNCGFSKENNEIELRFER